MLYVWVGGGVGGDGDEDEDGDGDEEGEEEGRRGGGKEGRRGGEGRFSPRPQNLLDLTANNDRSLVRRTVTTATTL